MQPIVLGDPAWPVTFLRCVTPHHDELLAGLLLRCDELLGERNNVRLSPSSQTKDS